VISESSPEGAVISEQNIHSERAAIPEYSP
jgi:hypothetical protein